MNTPRLVFGAHLAVAAVVFGIGLFIGVNGNSVQIVIFGGIAIMLAVLGKYTSRVAARM